MAEAFGVGTVLDLPLHVAPSTIGSIDNDAAARDQLDRAAGRAVHPDAGSDDRCRHREPGDADEALPVDSIQAPDLTVVDKPGPGGDGPGRLLRGRRGADHDDDQRRRPRHGPQGAHPGHPGRRQDRHGAELGATDHAWFVGFAPADHPKIAVAVFVKNGGATGGDISAPDGPAR